MLFPPVAPAQGRVTRSEAVRPVGDGAWFVLARILDQGGVGLVTLLLAQRSTIEAYGAIALLLIGYAAATTLADLGVAHELLRLAPGDRAAARNLRVLRTVSWVVGSAGVASAIVAPGRITTAAAAGAVIWGLAGWVYLRQSAALLQGEHRRLALAGGCGSLVLVTSVVLFARGPAAVTVVGLALIVRLLLEGALLPSAKAYFSGGGRRLRPASVFATHLVAYGGRNLDYLVAGPVLGGAAFAQYVLAYRLANSCYAPFGAVTTRLGITTLGDSTGTHGEGRYRALLASLATLGLLAGVATVVASMALDDVAGERWSSAGRLMAVLAIAMPWRFIEGLIAPVAYTAGRHGDAVKVEAVRLVVIALAVLVGTHWGIFGLAVAMTAATIVTSWGGHRWVAPRAGRRLPRSFDWAMVATVVGLVVTAVLAGDP